MGFERSYSAIVADDHAIVRDALKSLLNRADNNYNHYFNVIAEVTNGIEAIAAVRQHRPDLLMLDVNMPHAGGTEVLVEARRWSPQTRVVVFTAIETVGKIAELVQVRADGLFCKSDDLDELQRALPLILSGTPVICSRYMQLLEDAPDAAALTDRERQVLSLVTAGRTNREIADTLGISIKTVDRHRTSVMGKTGSHSAAELIAYALREGLFDPGASA